MDHRPYEEWLLNDERLNSEQDRELRDHLRSCPSCARLAQANLALRSSAVIAPAPGFAQRFQVRLAAQQAIERRRAKFGLLLLLVIGLGGLLWLLVPYLPYLALSPDRLASLWISKLVSLTLTARALGAFGKTLLSVLASTIPANLWALAMFALTGMGLMSALSIRRLGNIQQSAR